MYHFKVYSENEIDRFKESTKEKNNLFNYNNFDITYDTRWVGVACEDAFREYLNRHRIVSAYNVKPGLKDEYDFAVGQDKIDVKAISTKVIPKPDYACDVAEKQYKKIIQAWNPITVLVFARFILPKKMAMLLGAISKADFVKKATFYPVGSQRGSYKATTNFYELPISELTDLDIYFKSYTRY